MKIIIWTGAAWECWGPLSVDGGIGGSETAAIQMGNELARRGHEVVMFGDHDGFEGYWTPGGEGGGHPDYYKAAGLRFVRYLSYKKAVEDPKLLACDVLVSSRSKQVVRLKPDAKVKVLWVHDVHVGDDWENDLFHFDRVYCLTRWHKGYFESMYPHIDPTKIQITRNGIDPSRFADLDWRKKQASFVYSSSPDRGLDVLMDLWPSIKTLRPEATLDVYYGFETWRKLLKENKRGLAVVDYLQGRVESMAAEGVTYHGRVGQKELAEAHKKALIWLYPTKFCETYGITALEAQAAGSCVITSKLAGLTETASKWDSLIEGSNKSREYQDAALDWLGHYFTAWDIDKKHAEAFSDEEIKDDVDGAILNSNPIHLTAQAARRWALKQTWATLAGEWEDDFNKLVEAK